MATIRKPTYTKPLPTDAKPFTRNGKQFAKIKHKGRTITCPVTKDGRKLRVETDEWWVRYKDASGKWREEKGYTDKTLTDELRVRIEARVAQERDAATDPIKAHKLRPIGEHLEAFQQHLAAKENTPKHVAETVNQVQRIIAECGMKTLADLTAGAVESFLKELRSRGKRGGSIATSNHYLVAAKRFAGWLVRDRRMKESPLAHLSALNTRVDRRHDRRAISIDEFGRLVKAAECGRVVESVAGADRAVLYILAAWTGYRRAEMASLTAESFDLDSPLPSVRILAGYAKNRRADTVPLHSMLVERLRGWLAGKGDVEPGEPVFALRSPSGHWRKTFKMMQRDLAAARATWIGEAMEAGDAEEAARREASDFLTYQNEDGLFADFHANRHTFISNLGKAGVPLAMGQKLARHHDPKLTSNVYTHLDLRDKLAAIELLPAPPEANGSNGSAEQTFPQPSHSFPHGQSLLGTVGHGTGKAGSNGNSTQPVKIERLGTPRHAKSQVETSGLEPPTFGMQIRCSPS